MTIMVTFYTQTNDVSMGNPLGLYFSNYYMSHVENIYKEVCKPEIYVHYIDGIFKKKTLSLTLSTNLVKK